MMMMMMMMMMWTSVELKQHKPWFDEECSKLLDKGSRLNCSGCRIEMKQTVIM
jgi:hypothetical protein